MCVLLATLAHLSLGLLTWCKWSSRNVWGGGGGGGAAGKGRRSWPDSINNPNPG